VARAHVDVKAMADMIDRVYNEFVKGKNIKGCHRPVGFLPHLWASPRIIQARIPGRTCPVEPQIVPALGRGAGSTVLKDGQLWDVPQSWALGGWVQDTLPTANKKSVVELGNIGRRFEIALRSSQLTKENERSCLGATKVVGKAPVENEIQRLGEEGNSRPEGNGNEIESEYSTDRNGEEIEQVPDNHGALFCSGIGGLNTGAIRGAILGVAGKQHVEIGSGQGSKHG